MKKLLLLMLSVLALTAMAQQKKVAVYVTGEDAGINKVLGSKLVSAIARSNEYSAIERTESFLAELSKEQNYQRTGAVDDSELSRLGKQFGVQYICVASVSDAFNEKYLSARLIDVETAQVERTASSSGAIQSLESLVAAANAVSTELLSALNNGRQSNSKKVAVYIVKNEAGQNIGRVLGDKLVAGFTNSGRYIAIERTNSFLAQLSKEQNYQQSGAVDDNDLSRLGKQFGVQYVCVADVSDVFGEKYISARLIDVETAEVVNTHDAGGEMNSMSSCLKIANEIAANLSKGTFVEQAQEKAEQNRKNAEIEAVRQKYLQAGYVDLGLPSGTWWKTEDEKDICRGSLITEWTKSFVEPISSFLPTQEDFQELNEVCSWEIVNERNRYWYKVTGPNGTSITFQLRFSNKYDLEYCTNFTYEANYLTSSIYTKETKKRDYKYFITERLFLDVCGGKRNERRLLDNKAYGEIYVRFVQKNIFQ